MLHCLGSLLTETSTPPRLGSIVEEEEELEERRREGEKKYSVMEEENAPRE